MAGFFDMRWNYVIIAIARILCIGVIMCAHPAGAQSIWLSPRWNVPDLMELFHANAPWQEVASHTEVFEIGASPRYPDADMNTMVKDLRRRGIGLLVGMLPLSADWSRCGVHVEGYSAYGQSLTEANRLKSFDADVRFFGMDEPLYYGHNFNGRNACHSSIADLAKDVAAKVKQVQSIYPDVRIGDVEPMGVPNGMWLADLERWFDAFQSETGQNLAFFRADVQWNGPWQTQMQKLTDLLQRKGIPLQVIYDGDGKSDAEWTAKAIERFKLYESDGRSPPDVAIFQSWSEYPSLVLPETDGGTLTGLARQYIEWRRSHR